MIDIIEKTIEQIKQEKIHPTAKWVFEARNYLIWAFFTLSVLIGSLAISVIIFLLENHDFDAPLPPGMMAKLFLLSIPYFWLVSLALFIVLAYYIARLTKSGYKYHTYWIILASIIASIIFGVVLHGFQVGPRVHFAANKKLPLYRQIHQGRERGWIAPEQGMIGGKIIEVSSQTKFTLEDFNGKTWQVVLKKDAHKGPRAKIKVGQEVRMIGKKTADNTFETIDIRPWLQRPGPPLNMNSPRPPLPPAPMPMKET